MNSFLSLRHKLKSIWNKSFRQTHKNLFYVFSSSVISKIFGASTTFILPNLLGPTNYGIWVTLLIISTYSPIFHLGVLEALFKNYPYYKGKNEIDRAKELEGNVFCFIIISALIFIVAGVLYVNLTNYKIIIGFIVESDIVIITSALSLISSYHYFRISAHQKFKACSIIDALRSIVSSIYIIILTIKYSLFGAVLGYLITELTILFVSYFLGKIHCGKIKLRLNIKIVRDAIRTGFPISLVYWVNSIASTTDRIISPIYLGKTVTGYYGLGFSAVNLLGQIPKTINSVLYPKINEELGKNSNNAKIVYLTVLPSLVSGMILPFIVGCSVQIIPLIYMIFFPKYISGQASAQILLVSFYFGSIASSATNFLIAKACNKLLLLTTIVSTFIGVSLTLLLLKLQCNMISLALGRISATILHSIILWVMVFKYLNIKHSEKRLYFSVLYIPAVVMSCICCISNLIIPLIINYKIWGIIINLVVFALIYNIIIFRIKPYKEWSNNIIIQIGNSFSK